MVVTDDGHKYGLNLLDMVLLHENKPLWPTPQATNTNEDPEEWERRKERHAAQGVNLQRSLGVEAKRDMYPTPRSIDAEPVAGYKRSDGSMALPAAVLEDEGVGALNRNKFPTPRAGDSLGGQSLNATRERMEGGGDVMLSSLLRWGGQGLLVPTPTASDATLNAPTYASPLNKRMGTHEADMDLWLSPRFVEWLMGWPIGWTSLAPLPRGTVRRWAKAMRAMEWWTAEPEGVPRIEPKDGETKVRLFGTGNGQVALVFAVIWRLLEDGGCVDGRTGRPMKNARSKIMAAVKGERTGPEEALAGALESIPGCPEFAQNDRSLPGSPDMAFHGARVAVFVDGCFWHGCPEHYREPRTNVEYWRPKMARNRERDAEVDAALKGIGWLPVRIWEHGLRDGTEKAALSIIKRIKRRNGHGKK